MVTPSIRISDRIRALAAEGHSRSEIARRVDRSYQQVRQVLAADEARARRHQAANMTAQGVTEADGARYQAGLPTLPVRLDVDHRGRLTLPPAWGIRPGAAFLARNFMGDIVLTDVRKASDHARIGVDSATDELIAERRWEAMREFDD